MIEIYTDWHCLNDWELKRNWWEWVRDKWGVWIAIFEDWRNLEQISLSYLHTTNNKMELLAVWNALMWINSNLYENPWDPRLRRFSIISDSQYAIKSVCPRIFNREIGEWEKWWIDSKYERKNWSKIKNLKHIKGIIENLSYLNSIWVSVYFHWVRWHSGIEWNELADKLSSMDNDEISVDPFDFSLKSV